jgi:hypothetical protein
MSVKGEMLSARIEALEKSELGKRRVRYRTNACTSHFQYSTINIAASSG